MGKIPEFSRTVLPQTAQYGLADAERQRGSAVAGQHRQNAHNIATTAEYGRQTQSTLNQMKLREAEADNATAVNDGVIEYKRQAVDAANNLRRQREANPANFGKDFDKELERIQGDFMKRMPSEVARIALRQTLGNVRNAYYEDNLKWENTRKVSLYGERVERSAENLRVLARQAALDGKELDDLFKDADATAVAGSTIVAPEKVEKVKETIYQGMVSDYMDALVENNPDKARQIMKSRKFDQVLGTDNLERYDSALKAQEKVDLSDEIGEVEMAAKLGITVPKDKLTSLIGRLDSAGLERQAGALRDFAEVQDAVVSFAKMPLTDQTETLKTMRASIEGGNMGEVKKFAAMSEVLQTKQAAIASDPWPYYSGRKIVAEPEPLQFGDPAAMAAELDKRRIAVQQVKDLDGITMPIMTPGELDGMKKAFETAKPEEIASLTASIGTALKPEEQRAVAQAMAPKSGSLAVAIANAEPEVAEKIVMGAQIDGLVSEKDVTVEVLGRLQDVVTDPVRFEQLNDAIYSYYKTLQFQARDKNTAVNGDYVDQAITAIMGPVVSVDTKFGWGGVSNVLSYKENGQWVDEQRLSDILTSLTDDRIVALNGALPVGTAGVKYTAKDIYKTGRFVSNGEGVYAILDEFGEPIGNENGTIFQIDARKLEQLLKVGQ